MAVMAPTARGAIAATSLAMPSADHAMVRGDGAWPEESAEQAVAWEDGVITYVGPADGLADVEPEWFEGCTIAPGFVDCHTHLPFAGWRADEFEARLSGVSYRELHGEGGIYRSARMLAEANDDEVLAFSRSLVQEMAEHGTTALELKTGYGLSVEAELRQARLARRLAQEAPQTCSVTLLACHAVPEGMQRADWVRTVCDELIPAAANQGLVDAVDVYVEDIAFTVDDLAEVARSASEAGLPLHCHADQLGPSGAAEAAVALGAPLAEVQEAIGLLQRANTLVRIGEHHFARAAIDTLRERLRAFLVENGTITAQAWKELTGTTRKYSIPLAEHFDAEKLTLRVGETRKLRR